MADESVAATTWDGRLHSVWNAFVGGLGALMGINSHVLHHISLLAGTALVAGSGGTALFVKVGLLASVPFLLRLHRRFGTWRAPLVGLLVFAQTFTMSAFVVGPAISGQGGDSPPRTPGLDRDFHHGAG